MPHVEPEERRCGHHDVGDQVVRVEEPLDGRCRAHQVLEPFLAEDASDRSRPMTSRALWSAVVDVALDEEPAVLVEEQQRDDERELPERASRRSANATSAASPSRRQYPHARTGDACSRPALISGGYWRRTCRGASPWCQMSITMKSPSTRASDASVRSAAEERHAARGSAWSSRSHEPVDRGLVGRRRPRGRSPWRRRRPARRRARCGARSGDRGAGRRPCGSRASSPATARLRRSAPRAR